MKKIVLTVVSITTLFSGATLFTSCDRDDVVSSIDNNATIVENKDVSKLLKFVDIQTRLKDFQENSTNSKQQIILVEFDEWGRASRDCESWGLCNAHWFPQVNKASQSSKNMAILELDSSNNKYFIDILLAEEAPQDLTSQDLALVIDQDFGLNVKNAIGKNLLFKKGAYQYSHSLGIKGGYRIYLD